MPYGRDNNNIPGNNMDQLKKMVSEKMGGVDVNNISPDQVKGLLMNEINKNSSIDPSVKEKINKGDMEGLKEEIIKYLTNNKSADGSSEQLINMLKNNDMEGLKRQLMTMLLTGMGSQKKNEVETNPGPEIDRVEINEDQDNGQENPGTSAQSEGSSDNSALMNLLYDNIFSSLKDDKRISLLNSIKPFVSEKRQKGIDDCIRVMNLVAFFENFMGKAGK